MQTKSYAGVDWASDKHDVLVADAAGERLLAATFAHDEKGLRSLCRQLLRAGCGRSGVTEARTQPRLGVQAVEDLPESGLEDR